MESSNIVVMKFGGTSVGSIERIEAVAKRVTKRIREENKKIVVVVSAMSGETDRLIKLANGASGGSIPKREYHQLLASGEQVSAALTSMAIEKEGFKSVSLLAHQVPILTKTSSGLCLIESIDTKKLQKLLDNNIVPVVAGFQGVDEEGNYTTLGRGGSDNTAVAIAAVLGPCRCEILTDVDGVYTALPSLCKKAKKLKSLNYEEMLELASSGAKVLQARSVALAHKYRVPLIVCSSFSEVPGTEIVEEYQNMENAIVSGITCRTDEVKFTIRDVPDVPGAGAKLFKALADASVNVDMIVQGQGLAGKVALSTTVPSEMCDVAYETLKDFIKSNWPDSAVELDADIAKLSVVGEGMRNHAGVAYKVFKTLGDEGINVQMVVTSEIKMSV